MSRITGAGTSEGTASLQSVRNFRDIGGVPVADGRRLRPGLVYRSGHFGSASEADRATLRNLGVRLIDLRNAWEAELEDLEQPSVPAEAAALTEAVDPDTDLWEDFRSARVAKLAQTLTDGDAEQAMLRLYSGTIAGNPSPFAACLTSLATGALPVVVHCSAGKDRTGWAIAVLLEALGARQEDIYADYEVSSLVENQYVIRTPDGDSVKVTPDIQAIINPLMEARPKYLEAAWATVEKTWGSRASYLEHGLGLTPELLATLRQRLTA